MQISKIIPEFLNKIRVDTALVDLKFISSRQKALSLVMSGRVYLDNKIITKAGTLVKSKSILKVINNTHDWVSRGGIKLNSAVEILEIDVKDKICLDIGCSTGGFTDVLLTKSAKKIFSVDVGYGQFDWKLRNSEKVELFEKTNARFLTSEIIYQPLDLVVCDVSFISLKKVIKPVKPLLKNKFEILALIKPQFEAKKELVGRGGIIKDPEIHDEICTDLKKWFASEFKIRKVRIIPSSIKGQKGNKEFFIYIKN